jgi:hypothetical protein
MDEVILRFAMAVGVLPIIVALMFATRALCRTKDEDLVPPMVICAFGAVGGWALLVGNVALGITAMVRLP